MRRLALPPLGRLEPGGEPHAAAEPRAGIGRGRPDVLVDAREDHQVRSSSGALRARPRYGCRRAVVRLAAPPRPASAPPARRRDCRGRTARRHPAAPSARPPIDANRHRPGSSSAPISASTAAHQARHQLAGIDQLALQQRENRIDREPEPVQQRADLVVLGQREYSLKPGSGRARRSLRSRWPVARRTSSRGSPSVTALLRSSAMMSSGAQPPAATVRTCRTKRPAADWKSGVPAGSSTSIS